MMVDTVSTKALDNIVTQVTEVLSENNTQSSFCLSPTQKREIVILVPHDTDYDRINDIQQGLANELGPLFERYQLKNWGVIVLNGTTYTDYHFKTNGSKKTEAAVKLALRRELIMAFSVGKLKAARVQNTELLGFPSFRE